MEAGVVRPGAGHPLEAMVSALRPLIGAGAEAAAWSLSPDRLAGLLSELHREVRQLQAIETTLLAEADRQQVGDPLGYAETAGWWAAVTRATKPAARRQVKLARRLDADEHEPTRTAALAGAVSTDQASVIVKAVEDLPTDLTDPALRAKAENHLIEFAANLDPKQLAVAGRKILDVEAPEIAEQALARLLEAEEAQAEATSHFSIRPDGHGSMIGKFKVPLLAGRILEKHVEALAAPKHQNAMGAMDATRIPKPWRWGAAFTEYLETRPASSIPNTGGIAATVLVTMSLETMMGSLQAAGLLDTGELISPGQARRLLAGAEIIPAVLGTNSEVLDIGRGRRLHTKAQRIAIALRDKTCIVQDCDRGPAHAHFHHLTPWSQGGSTSVENGAMICAPHHTQIHDPRYTYTPRPHGKIKFHRRT